MSTKGESLTDKLSVRQREDRQTCHLETLSHGLYFHPDKFVIDGRSALGQGIKRIVEALLERFSDPAPAVAKLLAQRTAYKLLRAASYEGWVLAGIQRPLARADRDYLKLTGSIRADIQTLYVMSKDAAPGDKTPDLKEYLAMLQKASQATLINPKGEAAPPPANESPAPQPEAEAGEGAAFDWESTGEGR